MRAENNHPIAEPGDILVCGGITQTIKSIYTQSFWGHYDPKHPTYDWGIFLEAETSYSRYIYWKQYCDCNGTGYIHDDKLMYSRDGIQPYRK